MTDSNTATHTLNTELPTLADTCMLAVLGRKRLSTTRRADSHTEEQIRTQLGDDSITLNRHLFKDGPVRNLLRVLDRCYADHKAMTAPWVDRGPRLLPAKKFQEYADTMEDYKLQIAELTKDIIADWDNLVQADIDRRSKGKTGAQLATIDVADYPSADDAAYMFSIEWKVRPINKGDDFRTEVPEYVKERLNDELTEAVAVVRHDLIKRMLEPVEAAIEKLKVPIGEPGSVFRDSLVENLQSALYAAKTLNVTGDADLTAAIDEMNLVVNGYVGSADSLRQLEGKRSEAVDKLRDLTKTFAGL